jgi:hypothetical protein
MHETPHPFPQALSQRMGAAGGLDFSPRVESGFMSGILRFPSTVGHLSLKVDGGLTASIAFERSAAGEPWANG